jgi:hypothetical protein
MEILVDLVCSKNRIGSNSLNEQFSFPALDFGKSFWQLDGLGKSRQRKTHNGEAVRWLVVGLAVGSAYAITNKNIQL